MPVPLHDDGAAETLAPAALKPSKMLREWMHGCRRMIAEGQFADSRELPR